MNIDWQVVSHSDQRYETSGDWFWSDGSQTLFVRVSHLSDVRYEFLLGLHETIEAFLCHWGGISQAQVDDFDMPYEAAHQRGDSAYPCGCPRKEYSDPGDDKHSPYYWPHRIADAAERVVAMALHVNWADYDAEVDKPPK